MTTGTKLIQEAGKRIKAHSPINPISPEDISSSRDTLNSMMMLWLSQGIDIGVVPLDDPGDNLNEPMDATQAIIDNLAIFMAPNFESDRIKVTPSLKRNATIGYRNLLNLYYSISIPDKVISSTTPWGQGNQRGAWSRTFVRRGWTLNADDG